MNPSAGGLGNTSLFPATSRDSSEVLPATAPVIFARPTMPRASPAHDRTAAGRYHRSHGRFASPLCLSQQSPVGMLRPENPAWSPAPQLRSWPGRKPARAVAKFPPKTTGNLQFALIWTSSSPGVSWEGLGKAGPIRAALQPCVLV